MRLLRFNGGYSVEIHVAGLRFITPVINGFCNEGPDPALLEVYRKVLPDLPGGFLDIGANVGQTLLAVRASNVQMPYLGCEPNVSCAAYLQALIHQNKIQKADVLPVALMDRPGIFQLQLYRDSEADSSASLVEGFRPEEAVLYRRSISGHTWHQINEDLGEQQVAFVKIDVEGAELEVLRTIKPVLYSQRPWLMLEILPVYRSDYSDRLSRQTEIESIFSELDYKIMRCKKEEDGRFKCLRLIDSIGIHENIEDCDYLVVPSEELEQVKARGLPVVSKS